MGENFCVINNVGKNNKFFKFTNIIIVILYLHTLPKVGKYSDMQMSLAEFKFFTSTHLGGDSQLLVYCFKF